MHEASERERDMEGELGRKKEELEVTHRVCTGPWCREVCSDSPFLYTLTAHDTYLVSLFVERFR